MRALPILLVLVGLALPARAGVYTSLDRPPMVTTGLPNLIFGLRSAAVEPKQEPGKPKQEAPKDSARAAFLRDAEEFEALRRKGKLSTPDAILYSGALIRLGRTREAQKVLREADQSHFLVQSNLAGAFQQDGEYEQALEHQTLAVKLWPKVWAGYPPRLLAFYLECERANLRLLRYRDDVRREKITPVPLDPIFPGVRFQASKRGDYAAGVLDPDMADRLPTDAALIAAQLAIWQPRDLRLCWLLAELLNAQAELLNGPGQNAVVPAYALLASLADSDAVDQSLVRPHRTILERAVQLLTDLHKDRGEDVLRSVAFLPPATAFGCPIAGDAMACAAATMRPGLPPEPKMLQWKFDMDRAAANQNEFIDQQTPRPLPFNVVQVAISFFFGLLVATLLALQWARTRPPRPAVALPGEPRADPPAAMPSQAVQQGPPS